MLWTLKSNVSFYENVFIISNVKLYVVYNKSSNKNTTTIFLNNICVVANVCVIDAMKTLEEVRTLSKVLCNFSMFSCFMIVTTTNLIRQRLF